MKATIHQHNTKKNIGASTRCATLLLVGMFLMNTHSEAAICALRNPDRDVYVLFPEATNYKAFYRDLDSSKRKMIEDELGQSLDLNDVGTHTFYVILKDTVPIGFIHARAEWGSYGNVEVIWALNLDGSLKDYLIQRSRKRGTKEVKEVVFRSQFSGKKLGDAFVHPHTKKINEQFIKPVEGYVKTSSLIAYSAHKTLLLNNIIFGEVIRSTRS